MNHSKPMPVTESFTFEDSMGLCLRDIAQIELLVTFVDVSRFLAKLESIQSLRERELQADPRDQRMLSHLLCNQVEFANVITLIKCNLMNVEPIILDSRLRSCGSCQDYPMNQSFQTHACY